MKVDLKFTEWEDMDWIYLVQNRDHWSAVIDVVMNIGVHIKRREFFD
jgi:hypothetical protein